VSVSVGSPTYRKPPFRFSSVTRVAFSDTDAQGVVYFGRYMPYCDQSRVEYHRHLGVLAGRSLMSFAMRAVTVEYFAPARFDDLLEIFVRVSRIGNSSIQYEHAGYLVGGDQLMMTSTQTMVHIDPATRRAVRVPDELRRVFADFEGQGIEFA
jgi:acyl-CoA thioester hydrolase